MNFIKVILLAFFLLSPSVILSTDYNNEPFKTVKKNSTCHWCRASKNKISKRKKIFKDCPNNQCKMSYCSKLVCQQALFENDCLHCRKECCCLVVCDKTHYCCFTERRTQTRHASGNLKWTKKKRTREEKQTSAEETTLIEDDEQLNERPKKKSKVGAENISEASSLELYSDIIDETSSTEEETKGWVMAEIALFYVENLSVNEEERIEIALLEASLWLDMFAKDKISN